MFTGIILAVGTIDRIEPREGDVRLHIATGKLPVDQIQIGDSIAVNGVCLTVIDFKQQGFAADVSRETLARTTLHEARTGTRVNLELALLPSTRLGGHLVSGHVDGIGHIIERVKDARSWKFRIEAPGHLARYIARKGSITIDGISLTVNEVENSRFSVNIVPHTLSETTLGTFEAGHRVNLEVDLIARYLERLLEGDGSAKEMTGVTMDLLKKKGFV